MAEDSEKIMRLNLSFAITVQLSKYFLIRFYRIKLEEYAEFDETISSQRTNEEAFLSKTCVAAIGRILETHEYGEKSDGLALGGMTGRRRYTFERKADEKDAMKDMHKW